MTQNKKIFVTGASGFIGSHLVDTLIKNNFLVTALVKYNSNNDWGNLNHYKNITRSNLRIIMGDIRDLPQMINFVRGNDIVINLAALIGIPYSYEAYNSYYETNVKGTMNLLTSSLQNNVKRIFTFSTSEVYGSALYTPIDEDHPLQAQSPYSASKIAADKLCESFIKSYDAPITIIRPFNTYGPRQSNRAVIPTIINQFLSSSKFIKLGNIKTKRDYVYIEDTITGIIKIMKSSKTKRETINIASQKNYSIDNIYKEIKSILKIDKKIRIENKRVRPDKSEVINLLGSNKKLKKIISWKPSINLKKGLIETVKWNKDNLNKKIKIEYTI